jgi:hypothetical protein
MAAIFSLQVLPTARRLMVLAATGRALVEDIRKLFRPLR